MSKIPGWAENALQGITFWIGHRRSIYRHHVLTEGAIVAELANLINNRLVGVDGTKKYLYCEVLFRNLLTNISDKADLENWGNSRVDLLVASEPVPATAIRKHDFSASVTQVIEVKRASAAKSMINEDLSRLAALVSAKPSVRAFLIVVGEADIPESYVSIKKFDDGRQEIRAKTGEKKINGTACHYKVKRVCKASSSFKSTKNAHYACLIEVLPNR